MKNGYYVYKSIHAAIPEKLYLSLLKIARDMALAGDGDIAFWLMEEVFLQKTSIIRREFDALKREKDFTEQFYGKPCVVCGCESDTIDHIVPISGGGTNDPLNLQPMCRSCNSTKNSSLLSLDIDGESV